MPSGGYKVVLEYASKMAADGMQVTLLYPVALCLDEVAGMGRGSRWKMYKKSFTKVWKGQHSVKKWFPLDRRVREKMIPFAEEKFIPDGDFIFATAWETAEWVNMYSPVKGKKMYLVQHYEDWYGTEKARVDATWKMPLHKIVIATWLKEYATALGEKATLIRNGLNFKDYYIEKPIAERAPHHVSMLYHDLEIKGSKYGIEALQQVKAEVPELEVTLFGAFDRPAWIPDWMRYYYLPTHLRDIYNQSAIFITASIEEGWGLPRAEAMQCGCAVVLTATGGHLDFGTDGEDCLFTPVKDAGAMAAAVIELIRNNPKRIRIAAKGNETVQQFTWEHAYQQLKQCLQ